VTEKISFPYFFNLLEDGTEQTNIDYDSKNDSYTELTFDVPQVHTTKIPDENNETQSKKSRSTSLKRKRKTVKSKVVNLPGFGKLCFFC
jgi:hypothetical protein